MKYLKLCLTASAVAFLVACGVSQSDYDKAIAENESLKTQLDELRNGDNRLAAIIDKAYAEKNYGLAKTDIELLALKHPESPRNAQYKGMLQSILQIEATEAATKATAEKEQLRLANLNNTGIWENTFYVDNFGDKTKDAYVRNAELINGTFSNTATQDSPLNVRLLIDGATKISIMLYEYAGNNPVKAMSEDNYALRIKDKDGKEYELGAVDNSDRLTLSSSDSKALNDILLKGGRIQFLIVNDGTPTTQYQFTINDADWYGNAYQKLIAK